MNYVLNTLKNKTNVIAFSVIICLFIGSAMYAQDAKTNEKAINYAKTDIPNPKS
jgi:hypothetical protein